MEFSHSTHVLTFTDMLLLNLDIALVQVDFLKQTFSVSKSKGCSTCLMMFLTFLRPHLALEYSGKVRNILIILISPRNLLLKAFSVSDIRVSVFV